MTDLSENAHTADYRIHKAVDGTSPDHCAICGQRIQSVPGGSGKVWVHGDSRAVVAPNPPGVESENLGRNKDKPLNDIMDPDHVIRVHRDGQITNAPAITAPTLYEGALQQPADGRWQLMDGYTSQQGGGNTLHNCESVGNQLERDIRATPGVYVAILCHWSPVCTQCGQAAGYQENGVSHHLTDDGGIDHDTDADHVALVDEDYVEGWGVAYIHDDEEQD